MLTSLVSSFTSKKKQEVSNEGLINLGSRLCHGSVLSSSVDLTFFLDHALSTISTASNAKDRAASYRLISMILTSSPNVIASEGRLNSLIERLPGLLEANIIQDEMDGLLIFTQTLLNTTSIDTISRINKIFPKIAGSGFRIASKEATNLYGLNLLIILAQSQFRSLLAQNNSSSMITLCKKLSTMNSNPSICQLASYLISLLTTMEPIELWNVSWITHIKEMSDVILLLGMNGKKQSKTTPIISTICNMYPGITGSKKAIAIERTIRGHCCIIENMISSGCTSGPIALDLTTLIPFLSTVLTSHIEFSINDAKSIIENEYGISPANVVSISSQLKIYSLRIIKSLLSSHHKSLLKISSVICRLLSSQLSSKEFHQVKELGNLALECVSLAAKCFPTVIAKSSVTVLIVDMLQLEINHITKPKLLSSEISDISQSTKGFQKKQKKSKNNNDKIEEFENNFELNTHHISILLQTNESLLLFCGPLLPPLVRESIEISLGQALSCISRGVISPQLTDRKIKRSDVGILRENPELQILILQLATTELLSSSNNGLLSGNGPLLRIACESCLINNITSTYAARALLVIEGIVHPTAITIPTTPAVFLARNMLERKKNDNHDGIVVDRALADYGSGISMFDDVYNSNNNNDVTNNNNVDNEIDIIIDVNVDNETHHSKKKSRTYSEVVTSQIININNNNNNNQPSKIPTLKSSTFTSIVLEKESDSDNDDLPDINIDADPDSI